MSFGHRKIPRHLLLDPPPDRRFRRTILGVVACMFAIALLATTARADGDPGAGELRFEGSQRTAVLLSTKVEATLSGMVAQVTYRQQFYNASPAWQEAVYAFPLPENAAVSGLKMKIGEREIVGEIREKQEAKALYMAAKKSGKRAALTAQARPNLFSQRVANIPPGESIDIEIRYVHTVAYTRGRFDWSLPMTITPRYDPGELEKKPPGFRFASTDIQAHQHAAWGGEWSWSLGEKLPITTTEFVDQTPEHFLTLDVTLDAGFPLAEVAARYHSVSIQHLGDSYRVSTSGRGLTMDRDFVLSWQPEPKANPQAALFVEHIDNEPYALMMVLPPQVNHTESNLARDIVFVIDVSGSMGGQSIVQAKAGLLRALSRLRPQDRFNIIAFNDQYLTFASHLHPADPHWLTEATRWVNRLEAGGGTEMMPALNLALGQFENTHSLQQLMFLTDGAVTNETALFQLLHNKLGNSRLFTVAIGSAPNEYFMKQAAQFGRGSFTKIADITEVASEMDKLLTKLSQAVATNIEVRWPGTAEMFPAKTPDLYADEPLLVSAKLDGLGGDVEIAGVTAQMPWQARVGLHSALPGSAIARVWARAKIENLEDARIAGADSAEIRNAVLDVALRHALVSRYTSFIAREKVVSRPENAQSQTVAVRNMMPAGHPSAQSSVRLPATATPAEAFLWISCFLILLSLVLYRLARDTE